MSLAGFKNSSFENSESNLRVVFGGAGISPHAFSASASIKLVAFSGIMMLCSSSVTVLSCSYWLPLTPAVYSDAGKSAKA
jgi:hypothetical protein